MLLAGVSLCELQEHLLPVIFFCLCAASDFNFSITVEASVRFVVTLFEGYIIPQPVMLRIILTSAEAARTGTRNITSETYVNTSRMIHEIPNSEVPYIQFKAQVALTVGSEVGPFIPILDSASVYRM